MATIQDITQSAVQTPASLKNTPLKVSEERKRENEPLIVGSSINKKFFLETETVHVLKDLNFIVPKNSFTIIYGPSGSGKSTLLNALVGLEPPDIRRLFIIEALVLSFLGASIGILIAWLFGGGVNALLANYAHSRGVEQNISLFFIPFWLIAYILIFTCLVGFLVVAYPARRAGRISPIDALRHE